MHNSLLHLLLKNWDFLNTDILHKVVQPSTQSPGKRMFKIGEYLANLHAKRFIVSCAPFSLHFCPQRCRTRQICKITCVLRTKLLLIVVVLIGKLMRVYYQQISNCCRPVLIYRLTDRRHQCLTDC